MQTFQDASGRTWTLTLTRSASASLTTSLPPPGREIRS